jgi:hypothetical protein
MAGIYERVRERLDQFPQGFPKTKSGVELEILKSLFSPEEAPPIFLDSMALIQTMAKEKNKPFPFD